MTNKEAKGNLMYALKWNDVPEKEALKKAIKALDNEDVLDKIRAEIVKQAEEWKSYNPNSVAYQNIANGLYRAVNIIDKNRKEDKE